MLTVKHTFSCNVHVCLLRQHSKMSKNSFSIEGKLRLAPVCKPMRKQPALPKTKFAHKQLSLEHLGLLKRSR